MPKKIEVLAREVRLTGVNNPGFNPVEFDGIRMQAGFNSFTLTPKQWIERTGAIGIQSKAGRYGGTYAQLVCRSNLENLNALFIGQALPQSERLTKLNQIAIQQMKLLTADERTPRLPDGRKGA